MKGPRTGKGQTTGSGSCLTEKGRRKEAGKRESVASTGNSVPLERERKNKTRTNVHTYYTVSFVNKKKDLRKDLLDQRDEQVRTGQETDEVRQNRRDELQNIYKEYAEKVVNPILEYLDIDEHTPEKACTPPIDDLEDYDVSYKMGHRWTERELMKLRFNLEEVKLEPRYWEMAQGIRNLMFLKK